MQAPGCALDLKDVKIANRTSLLKHFVIQREDPHFLCNRVIYASRELCARLRHRSTVKKEEAAGPVGGGPSAMILNRRSCHTTIQKWSAASC